MEWASWPVLGQWGSKGELGLAAWAAREEREVGHGKGGENGNDGLVKMGKGKRIFPFVPLGI